MPEAAEVKLNVDFLNKSFGTNRILKASINSGRFLKQFPKNWTKLSTELFFLETAEFRNIRSKGKYIYGKIIVGGKLYWFTSTLGMSGFWTNKDIKHNHLSFHTQNGEIISFNDARCFGNFNIETDSKVIDDKIGALGIDFFKDEDVINQFLSDKIQKRLKKLQNKQICEVLLNQSICAGVGNYIKCEALYRTKTHPATLLRNIPDFHLGHILSTCQRIIHDSYKVGGASFKSFKDESGQMSGEYSKKFQVYGKQKDPYGYDIIKRTFNDGRTTHFVPKVQQIQYI